MLHLKTSPYQQKLEQIVSRCPAPGCYCALNAIDHLSKADAIKDIDPEMAFFRGACAEEEAATAIFQSLKRLRYPNADLLKPREHMQKVAVTPFLWAIHRAAEPALDAGCKPRVEIIGPEGQEKLRCSFIAPGTEQRVYPIPPLDFALTDNRDNTMYDFVNEIDLLKQFGNYKEVFDYLRNGANQRNRVLYASNNGSVELPRAIEPFLLSQLETVTRLLTVFALIDGYPQQQSFVVQCLSAFVKMLGKAPEDVKVGW